MSNQANQKKIVKKQAQPTMPQTPAQKATEQKISRRQFFFIIIQTQIGVGILSLPHELHKVSAQDGWISLIIAGFLLQIILLVIWLIAKRYPDKNFFQMNEKVFSKWIGKGISFFFVLYFVSVGILIIVHFCRMISLWVLPNTPFWVLSFLMISTSVYLCWCGLNVMARLYTFLSFLIVFFILLLLYSMKEMNIIYILPVAEAGWGKIWKGTHEAILSFFGFIISLVIFSKVEGKPKDKLKTMFYAHWFVLVFYLFTVFVSFTFFSTKEIALVPEPLLYVLKSYEFQIVARIDLFFISMWIISVATSFSTYLYMANLGLMEIFQAKKTKLFNLIIAAITSGFSFYIGFSIKKMEALSKYVIQSGYIFSIAFPFLMLLVSFIVRKFKKGGG